ncbi:flagellar hook-associated protein FlgL [Crassaminicella thermophila]|uniref:Flagellar hook-associated protein FlgL n=1 Tax=Crassaminicella thermophila TaxID=2599308 RepID=A0A5C0SCX6_CRATE|nr:flagellar hook-associated protein FlgL [Crassaminicella thermophila]QEK11308.1 flagellar hook-associated protein FlgL [Crassaminicella thermophila]
MRITNSMMTNTMLLNLNNNLRRLDQWNKQMSTGKKFSMPSDNPIGVSKSLELNTAVAELEQHKRNAQDALSWLEITESAVEDVGNLLQRARELAVSADGTETKEDKEKIQVEIDQLKEQIIKVANTTYAGKHIFSGYKTDKDLLDSDGKYNIDIKNNEKMNYEVGISDKIDVNTLGNKLFGVIDPASLSYDTDLDKVNDMEASKAQEAQLIAVLNDFSKALKNDDQDGIQKAIARIDSHLDNVLSIRGEIGAKTNRVEMTIKRIDRDIINFTGLLSKNEDADMAEVIMKFKNDENVYRASLSVGAKAIQPSLVDFIR